MVHVVTMIGAGASAGVAFLAGVFKSLAADEVKAWTPRIADRLMHSAVDLHRASFGMHRILAKLHTAPKDQRVPFALYIFAVNKSVRIVLKVALASTKVPMTIEDIQIIARRILSGRDKD